MAVSDCRRYLLTMLEELPWFRDEERDTDSVDRVPEPPAEE